MVSNLLLTQQRADPAQMRSELVKHLTDDEIARLGVKLGAGADHPRAFVGSIPVEGRMTP